MAQVLDYYLFYPKEIGPEEQISIAASNARPVTTSSGTHL